MDTYRVVPVAEGQWAIERISDNGSSDQLPIVYNDEAEAAYAVLEITQRERREEQDEKPA